MIRVGTKKKVERSNQRRRQARSKATRRSTAGVGFNFEDLVSAWTLVRMLSGQSIPGMEAAGFQLQMQTHAAGWDIDDQLISASPDGPRLAISSKAAVKVTASGLPADFLLPVWRQWRRGGPLRQGTDGLAMASRGRHGPFEATWADIKLWCREGDAVSAVANIKASANR